MEIEERLENWDGDKEGIKWWDGNIARMES